MFGRENSSNTKVCFAAKIQFLINKAITLFCPYLKVDVHMETFLNYCKRRFTLRSVKMSKKESECIFSTKDHYVQLKEEISKNVILSISIYFLQTRYEFNSETQTNETITDFIARAQATELRKDTTYTQVSPFCI